MLVVDHCSVATQRRILHFSAHLFGGLMGCYWLIMKNVIPKPIGITPPAHPVPRSSLSLVQSAGDSNGWSNFTIGGIGYVDRTTKNQRNCKVSINPASFGYNIIYVYIYIHIPSYPIQKIKIKNDIGFISQLEIRVIISILSN